MSRYEVECWGEVWEYEDAYDHIAYLVKTTHEDVESWREVVGKNPILWPDLVRLYSSLTAWPQRAALEHLLTDQPVDFCPGWRECLIDMLRAPLEKQRSYVHSMVVGAITRLESDGPDFNAYYDDLERSKERAAELHAELVTL